VLTVLDDRHLQLSVADDGAGFDLSPINRAGNPGMGLGLLGMEERAVIAGGEMHIETTPGKGTIVRAILPDRKGGAHEADHPAAG
jgi:signal transduction histidine kinase